MMSIVKEFVAHMEKNLITVRAQESDTKNDWAAAGDRAEDLENKIAIFKEQLSLIESGKYTHDELKVMLGVSYE